MSIAAAPLFRDPVYDGAADPTVVWNRQEAQWWILYTSRRANSHAHGLSWVHGTDIGVASSNDNGETWLYRGVLNIEPVEPGHNTFWAPEVIWHENLYHMYVSYITGVPDTWAGERHILHYTSVDLWNWKYESRVQLSSDRVIDACVFQKRDGGFRMWYKDEADGSHTHAADSADLFRWHTIGRQTHDCAQEGPNVFEFGGKYWLIADMWQGIAVYSGFDLDHWTRQSTNLLSDAGTRREDKNRGHHADVLVAGELCYIFYFVHPGRAHVSEDVDTYDTRRSSLQAAQLIVKDGQLCALREGFPFYLPEID